MMEAFGAKCIVSPSNPTNVGKKILSESPDFTGSLGMSISEAVERCVISNDVKYALGSVLNYVLMHQTIIGLETKKTSGEVRFQTRHHSRMHRRRE